MSHSIGEKKILIIEDDQFIQKLLSISLNLEGYKIVTAIHGKEAIEVLQKEHVDIIICDLMMPVMDGIRFIRWLREEARMTLPVVVLTAVDNKKVREDILKAGATDIVYKSADDQALFEKLKHL